MKKQPNNVPMDIPKYINLRNRPKCKNCQYKIYCSDVNSKLECQKFARKFFTIELLIFVIPEILGIWWIYTKEENLILFLVFSLIYSLIILLLETIISYLACKISQKCEKKRKAKYDKKVEKIVEINEKIDRQNKGETEEYLNFIKEVSKVTQRYNELKKSIENMNDSEELVENKNVKEQFDIIVEKLISLNEKLNPRNYNADFATPFYKVQLKAIIEKTEIYIDLYEKQKLTSNQVFEFNKLLETVIKKIDKHTQYVLKMEEEKFINEIQKLNQNMSSEEEEE